MTTPSTHFENMQLQKPNLLILEKDGKWKKDLISMIIQLVKNPGYFRVKAKS